MTVASAGRDKPPAPHPGDASFLQDLSAAELRAGRVAPFAYTVLPPDSEKRSELQVDHAAALLDHVHVKNQLLPLLGAWSSAGIEVLLFKGFAMSEFIYPTPGLRRYGDVDLLMRTRDLSRAVGIARDLGWWDPTNVSRDALPSHSAFTLMSPAGDLEVDVHQWILHVNARWNGVQRRITSAAWDRSVGARLGDVPVRLLTEVDMAVIGLLLQQCWGEGWALRLDHWLDLHLLLRRPQVTIPRVRARAADLRCSRTVDTFLGERELWGDESVRPRGRSDVERARRGAIVRERPDLLFRQWLPRILMIPAAMVALPALAAAGATVVGLRLALRPGEGAEVALAGADRGVSRKQAEPDAEVHWPEHVVRWALKLAPRTIDRGRFRILVLYRILRARGWPVVYRQVSDSEVAWVEVSGRVLAASPRFGRLDPAAATLCVSGGPATATEANGSGAEA